MGGRESVCVCVGGGGQRAGRRWDQGSGRMWGQGSRVQVDRNRVLVQAGFRVKGAGGDGV